MSVNYQKTHLQMDESTIKLKGSPLRDLFKQLHKKELKRHMFGCDLDFVIVEKNPDVIVAFFDVKVLGEEVTFTEVIAYNKLLKIAPLYLLYTSGEYGLMVGEFEVFKYLGGDRWPNPPIVQTEHMGTITSWRQFESWEQRMRDAAKRSAK